MRRLLLSFILICLLTVPASAHPGGTDSSGGHYDHSTGEYHYHHGYGPHEHEDLDGDGDLDCPYNFKDKTGDNSGESSGAVTRYPTPTRPTVPLPTKPAPAVAEPEQEAQKEMGLLGVLLLLFSPAIPPLTIGAIIDWRNHKNSRGRGKPYHGPPVWEGHPERVPIKAAPPPKPSEPPKVVLLDDRTRLDQFLREYNPAGIIKVEFPPELRMAEDGTLYWGTRTPDKPFGSGTAYITGRSGKCWHMKCGCSGASEPIFMPAALRKYRPCGICVPSQFRSLQVPDWYYKYTRLRSGHFRTRQLSFFDEEDD